MATKTGNSNFVPELRDLVVALRDVDWHQLGTQLNVPQKELRKIDKECPEISRKLTEVLTYWQANEEQSSWEKIVKALERIGCHGNLITELKSKCRGVPIVSSSATVININDEKVYDRVQQNQPTFNGLEPVANGARKHFLTGYEDKQGHTDSCTSIATQTVTASNEISVKLIPKDDKINDLQYLLTRDLDGIKKKFTTLLCEVRESLSKKVSHKKIVDHVLLDYEDAFESADYNLFSAADKEELNSATSVNQVFRVLRKYWSFLKCDVLVSIVKHCGNRTDRVKIKDYRKQLKAFFDKRKVSEMPKDLILSSSVDEMRDKVLIKLDKEDPTLREITNLEYRICDILEVMPSVLLIIGVHQGCVEIIFSIPKHISQLIFSKPLTREQEERFREESILSLSCGHTHLTFIERKHSESDEKSIDMLPHHTAGCKTDQLSRFISQHLGSVEESIRQHERACAGKSQLEEDLKTKSQEIERLKSDLEVLKCQTTLSYQISTAEKRVSASEAEINELKRRMTEVESDIEDQERKLGHGKSAIIVMVELLAEQLQTMKERREYEQVELLEAQHDQVTLQEKLLAVTRDKDEEIEMTEKKYKTLLKAQRKKVNQEHRTALEEQREMQEKMLHNTEGRYQEALKDREAKIQDHKEREMQHVAELHQSIEGLEIKIKKLEAQLSRRTTMGRKLRQLFKRKKSDINDFSGMVLKKDKFKGDETNLHSNSLFPGPLSPTQDQCSYVSTVSPPLYDQYSLNSLPAMHFREIWSQSSKKRSIDPSRTCSQHKTPSHDFSALHNWDSPWPVEQTTAYDRTSAINNLVGPETIGSDPEDNVEDDIIIIFTSRLNSRAARV